MVQRFASYDEDFKLFVETGYIAVNQGDEEAALHLFAAADALRSNSFESRMGYAFIAVQKMELARAMKIYNTLLEEDANNNMAKAFLGLTLFLSVFIHKKLDNDLSKSGVLPVEMEKRAFELLNEALKNDEDEAAKGLARSTLEWFEQERSVEGGPFELKPSH
ncbi:hypothetical protein JYU14_02860 [Simkania negevensis]|uniref:Uncharacterized protein n=1 Tax=Simkania negevensis TaxID=83561 RepID=A0ABS3ARK0_9BACT|nr:hypothetical protein [Simkania negevensis]